MYAACCALLGLFVSFVLPVISVGGLVLGPCRHRARVQFIAQLLQHPGIINAAAAVSKRGVHTGKLVPSDSASAALALRSLKRCLSAEATPTAPALMRTRSGDGRGGDWWCALPACLMSNMWVCWCR